MIWLALLLAQNVTDPDSIARGQRLFAESCSVGYCHGVAGAAGRGPRLRGRKFDKNYLYTVTRDGIPNSAMPAWKGRLSDEEIWSVVAYVMSLATAGEEAPPPNPMPPGAGPASVAAFEGPLEARRGHDLLFDATRGTRCSTCHSMNGRGIAVGPDLAQAAPKSAGELVGLVRSKKPRHVLSARTTGGDVFPALRVEQSEKWIKLYDLTVTPPVLRTLERSEVSSLTENSNWQHESVARSYSDLELESIFTYLEWARSREK